VQEKGQTVTAVDHSRGNVASVHLLSDHFSLSKDNYSMQAMPFKAKQGRFATQKPTIARTCRAIVGFT
jgi:hypothetical protein